MTTKVTLDGVTYESDEEYGSEQLFTYLGRREEKREEFKFWLVGGAVWLLVVFGLAFSFGLMTNGAADGAAPDARQCIPS